MAALRSLLLLAFPLVSSALFRGINRGKNWADAVTTCSDDGARLASIASNEDSVAVHAAARAAGISGAFWIGGSVTDDWCKEDTCWEWVGSAKVFESADHWAKKEPNNWGRNERCLRAGADGDKWNDAKCSLTYAFVCDYGSKSPPFVCQ